VLSREFGSAGNTALCLLYLGSYAALKGEHTRAASLLKESLALEAKLGIRAFLALNLAYLAWVAAGVGRPEDAACLWGRPRRSRSTSWG
jgi:hypothetical protein